VQKATSHDGDFRLTVFIHWFQQNLNSSLSIKPSPLVSKTANICSRRSGGTS